MTFKEAAIEILKKSDTPMSASEIWDEIVKLDLIKSNGKTPSATLNSIILYNSNSPFNKKGEIIFEIISKNPMRYKLIDDTKEDLSEDNIIEQTKDEPFYECVMDDNETILKIYNIDGDLDYQIEHGDSFTYFISNSIKDKIKIGRTKNIKNRFNTLKTSNPDIEISLIVPREKYEKYYHDEFSKYHYNLEWYFYTKEIKEFIINEDKKRKKAITCYRKFKESIEIEKDFLSLF